MNFTYRGLKADYEKLHVTDKDVDQQLLRLQQNSPRIIPVTDRPAQMGDEVVLDYAGFCGGVQFEGGTAQKQTLVLGSNMFIPGFETQLIGSTPGSDVTVHVTFPEQYHAKELAGKAAEFRCHIHEIRLKSNYELDETFAREVGGCASVDEMKQKLKESLQAYYDERSEMELQDKLLRQASATLDYTPGKEELDAAVEEQMQTLQAQLAQKGLDLKAYCQFTGSTPESLREDAKPEAEANLRIGKTVEQIAALEKLEATQEDLASACQQVCRQNHLTMKELEPYYDAAFEQMLVRSILLRKTAQLVREAAEVNVVEKQM